MKKLDIIKYDIKNKKIDKNIKLMFLSDLHNRNIVNEIIITIKKENPDIIIMGGDMINQSNDEMDNFFDLCKKVNNRKVYYVPGNHEEMLDDADKYDYMNKVSKYSVEIIYNDKVNITKNIILYGFNSELDTYKKFRRHGIETKDITDKLGVFDKNKFNILIAHNPLEFDSYIDTNSDIVLSGHVHGGLVVLPLLGGLFSPDYTLFPKYYKGIYEKNNTKMIVSRGLGLSKRIPIRINNRPEITIINLIKNN